MGFGFIASIVKDTNFIGCVGYAPRSATPSPASTTPVAASVIAVLPNVSVLHDPKLANDVSLGTKRQLQARASNTSEASEVGNFNVSASKPGKRGSKSGKVFGEDGIEEKP